MVVEGEEEGRKRKRQNSSQRGGGEVRQVNDGAGGSCAGAQEGRGDRATNICDKDNIINSCDIAGRVSQQQVSILYGNVRSILNI